MFRFDAFTLRWIAIIGMVLNHIVIAWWEIIPLWLAIPMYATGGLTFPIMAYFVVEGYKHTSNLKKYILRLLIFGVISIPFHVLTFGFLGLNIMFTIIVGILCILLYDKMKIRPLFWILFVVIALLTTFPIFFDWAIIGVVAVLLTHIIKNEKARRIVPAVVSGVFMLLFSLLGILGTSTPYTQVEIAGLPGYDIELMVVSTVFIVGCLVAAFLLKNFNGQRGKRMKWLFYSFYPLHLAVLGIVALLMGWVDLSVFTLPLP
ncbi:MAG: conjugal transfer protein TraX [Defluviitaleaceae bacterium]|nr:conjugal transfer protein TraX [Defluviitaleaceae bacterium]